MKRLLQLIGMFTVIAALFVFDATAQWTVQTSGTTQRIRSIKPISAQVAWACAYAGTVLRTVNGGTTWQAKNTPDATFDNYSMDAIDSTTAWVFATSSSAGNTGEVRIYKTTNGGTSWTQVYTNPDSWSDAIKFFDANNGIAVGDPNVATKKTMVIVTTSNGGSTWTPVSAANIPAVDSVNDEVGVTNGMDFAGNSAFIITYGNSSTIQPRVLKSTDKGLTWTISPKIALDNSYGFAMKDVNVGIISNINSGSVARTTNGWATADSNLVLAGVYGLRAVDFIPGSSNTAVLVGGPTGTGIAAVSKDGGKTWTQMTVPTGVPRLMAVQFLNGTTGWAAGYTGAIIKYTGADLATAVEDTKNTVPTGFALDQNYPNPFNPTTKISYSVPKASFVELKVYDLLGRAVATLVNSEQTVGTHSVSFDAKGLSSGVYMYTMKAGDFTSTKSLVLVK
jgi:photosystem II stability/assembly factor-like uncharacterized protein